MANPTIRPESKGELAVRRLHIHTLRSLGHTQFLFKLGGGCVADEGPLWSYASVLLRPALPSQSQGRQLCRLRRRHGLALPQALCFAHGNTPKLSSREFSSPSLVPRTQKKSSQQRKQIAQEEPERDHQARRTGAEVQRKGSGQVSGWRVGFRWTLLAEVPAGGAEQVSIVNPAVHLNADREDLPSPATQIGSVLNPNLQTLRRTGNLVASAPPVWVTELPLTLLHDKR